MVVKVYRNLCLRPRNVLLLPRLHGVMEMKTETSENLWLGFLVIGLIIVIAIFLFMAGVKVVKKISAEISPQSKQAIVYEIRG